MHLKGCIRISLFQMHFSSLTVSLPWLSPDQWHSWGIPGNIWLLCVVSSVNLQTQDQVQLCKEWCSQVWEKTSEISQTCARRQLQHPHLLCLHEGNPWGNVKQIHRWCVHKQQCAWKLKSILCKNISKLFNIVEEVLTCSWTKLLTSNNSRFLMRTRKVCKLCLWWRSGGGSTMKVLTTNGWIKNWCQQYLKMQMVVIIIYERLFALLAPDYTIKIGKTGFSSKRGNPV